MHIALPISICCPYTCGNIPPSWITDNMNCMYHHMRKNCCSRQCKYFIYGGWCMFVCICTCTFVDQPHTTTFPGCTQSTYILATLLFVAFICLVTNNNHDNIRTGDDTFIKSTNNVEYFHQCFYMIYIYTVYIYIYIYIYIYNIYIYIYIAKFRGVYYSSMYMREVAKIRIQFPLKTHNTTAFVV